MKTASAPRILIVEDNPSDEELLLRQLEKAGFASYVLVINDGKRALSFLHGGSQSLVVMFLDLICRACVDSKFWSKFDRTTGSSHFRLSL